MRRSLAWMLTVISWLACQAAGSNPLPAAEYDVVVYGGTSAGVIAAVHAARAGKSVALIEPTGHLGGLTSSGLGFTDTGDKRVIGGLSREFYQRIKRHYDDPSRWSFEKPDQYARYRAQDDAMWTFEPRVAESVFGRMLAHPSITVHLRRRLDREHGCQRKDQRIVAITTESGESFGGRMFIDATYEGDLMAAAGVSYIVGRESNAQYNETLNGIQKQQNIHNHRFLHKVDPYREPGDPSSGLLPGVHADPPGQDGHADRRVQAYCFECACRMCRETEFPFPSPSTTTNTNMNCFFATLRLVTCAFRCMPS